MHSSPEIDGFLGMKLRDSPPIKINFAGVRGDNARNDANQSCLASSIISYQTNQLSMIEVDADIGQGPKIAIRKAKHS